MKFMQFRRSSPSIVQFKENSLLLVPIKNHVITTSFFFGAYHWGGDNFSSGSPAKTVCCQVLELCLNNPYRCHFCMRITLVQDSLTRIYIRGTTLLTGRPGGEIAPAKKIVPLIFGPGESYVTIIAAKIPT